VIIKAEFNTEVYKKEIYPNVVNFEIEDDSYWFEDKAHFKYRLMKDEVKHLVITD